MKNLLVWLLIGMVGGSIFLVGCSSDADVASHNLSKDADNFKVLRRVVLYNSITDKNILVLEGFCSLGNSDSSDRVSVTCKVAKDSNDPASYKKDIFLKSDNTLVFTDQLDPRGVSTTHYKLVFKPSTVIPDVEVR